MDFDEFLPDIGEFGKYQKLLLWVVLLPCFVPCGFHAYNQLFMAFVPDHWCKIPELDAAGYTPEVQRKLSIPKEKLVDGSEIHSKCRRYDVNFTEIVLELEKSGKFDSFQPNSSWLTTSCNSGWHFDGDAVENGLSIVSDWDIVCDKDVYPTLALVLFNVAGLIGNYLLGYLQDRIGRRPAFFIFLSIQCLFGLATAMAFDFISWLVFRIGVGFTVPAIMGTPLVMCIEMVGPSKRTFTMLVANVAYSACLVLLAGVVWLVRPWRQMALATTIPFLSFFLYWWVLPESPRWLLAHGRTREAAKIMRLMGKMNGKTLPDDYEDFLEEKQAKLNHKTELPSKTDDVQNTTCPDAMEKTVTKEKKGSRHYGISDLFRTPNMMRKTLIITFIWFTNTSVYVGLSYYAPVLGGDEYLNFFLAGAAEIPTYFFLWPTMDCWGRRWTLAFSMIVGGIACLTTFLFQGDYVTTLVLYCMGKFGISASFVVLPLMASELYPTVVRGLGLSFSGVAGMIGPIIIPLINYLGSEFLVLPLMIMGVLLVLGGFGGLALPETLHQHLPQTLEEGEAFGADFSMRDLLKCCPDKPSQGKKETGAVNKHTGAAEAECHGLVLRGNDEEMAVQCPDSPESR
ncbi:unnamed protein product [Notodromas monacha]|uniref:Major facilitator superfamily (MFS) profile domain-containing protein n=1 Tax=Notodromas monacha TaxID=399045 RepID=A0A7R9BVQ4_9CRUS|nr:unnamed protein product [Notodromas monacha]CAG0921635.1 unnamed protein product [Notodromas monacha]